MKERVFYLDLLKGISIPLVVVLHVAAVGLSETPVDSFPWQVCNLYDSFVRFVVPIFVMISGAIYLHEQKRVNVWKSVKHILYPLVLWSLAYSFVVNISHSHLIDGGWFCDFLRLAFITPTHTWFLYMLMGIYLIVPLLRSITRDRKIEEYFLFLWLVFGVILPSLSIIPSINHIVIGVVSKMYLHLPLSYTGLFVLGHYLNTYSMEKYKKSWPLIVVLGGVIMLSTKWLSLKAGTLDGWAYEYLNPLVILMAACIFIAAKSFCRSESPKNLLGKTIGVMARLSMGVYLFHVPVMILMRHYGLDFKICNAAFSVPLVSALVYFISFAVIFVISKIPVLKSYII